MLICLYDDRATNEIGLKLAVLSLAEHCPDTSVVVHAPYADEGFAGWMRKQPNATLMAGKTALDGWNVKPEILLRHLQDDDEVVWFDSDLMCLSDWRPLVAAPRDTLVVAEETVRAQNRGGSHRAVAWNLTPGRSLRTTVNTCLARVTRAHIPLLERWQSMLTDPRYVAAQSSPMNSRPLHLLGDQEVLTAVLCDEEFASIPVRFLRDGEDLVHCFGPAGYTPRARARMAMGRRVPPLVHAMGQKPWEVSWDIDEPGRKLREKYERAHGRLSPYAQAARGFRGGLGESPRWLQRGRADWTPLSLSGAELPLAVIDHFVRTSRARMGIARFTVEGLDSPRP